MKNILFGKTYFPISSQRFVIVSFPPSCPKKTSLKYHYLLPSFFFTHKTSRCLSQKARKPNIKKLSRLFTIVIPFIEKETFI